MMTAGTGRRTIEVIILENRHGSAGLTVERARSQELCRATMESLLLLRCACTPYIDARKQGTDVYSALCKTGPSKVDAAGDTIHSSQYVSAQYSTEYSVCAVVVTAHRQASS
jgi:hypothetical protein